MKILVQKLLQEHFSRKANHRTTMDDAVVEAALRKGGQYRHWGSKEEMLLTEFDQVFPAEMDQLGAI